MRRAFTVIELIVAISIVALMAALLLGAVQAVRATAARTACQDQLRQLALATQNHISNHQSYPHGVYFKTATKDPNSYPSRDIGMSWPKILLPHLEQAELHRQVLELYHDENVDGLSTRHQQLAAVQLKQFRCPADGRIQGEVVVPTGSLPGVPYPLPEPWALTNYIGVIGTSTNNGVLTMNRAIKPSEITDGTSQTLLFGERPTQKDGLFSAWYNGRGHLGLEGVQVMILSRVHANLVPPDTVCSQQEIGAFQRGKYNDLCSMYHFWSLHPGGANFAFADGSVRFISYAAEPILPALATRAGGETVNWD